jgi:hypothetical protein
VLLPYNKWNVTASFAGMAKNSEIDTCGLRHKWAGAGAAAAAQQAVGAAGTQRAKARIKQQQWEQQKSSMHWQNHRTNN